MGKVQEGRHLHHIPVCLQDIQEPEVELISSHLWAVVGRQLMFLELGKELVVQLILELK